MLRLVWGSSSLHDLLLVVGLATPASAAADYAELRLLHVSRTQPRMLYRIADQGDPLIVRVAPRTLATVPTVPRLRTVNALPEAALPPSAVLSTSASSEPAGSPSVLKAWWLWAGVGIVAVAGIVVAAVMLGSSATRTPDPVRGNVGGTVQTLGGP